MQGRKNIWETSGRKYKRISIVAALSGNKIIAPPGYSGTMDSSLSEYWFAEMLLPGMPRGSTLVMDNAAFHRKTQLLSVAKEQGYHLVFLPPYSPGLNPIEKFWSWLKRHLKKILPSFDDALSECFQVI